MSSTMQINSVSYPEWLYYTSVASSQYWMYTPIGNDMKTLECEVKNSEKLVTMQCSAGKPRGPGIHVDARTMETLFTHCHGTKWGTERGERERLDCESRNKNRWEEDMTKGQTERERHGVKESCLSDTKATLTELKKVSLSVGVAAFLWAPQLDLLPTLFSAPVFNHRHYPSVFHPSQAARGSWLKVRPPVLSSG